MKLKLLYIFLFLSTIFNVSGQSQKELADKYLTKRGELVFTFTANNIDEVRELSRILSFDHGQDHSNPLKIKAYANKKSFSKFLKYALPYEVDVPANEPKNVVMYDKNVHGKGVLGKSAALTFPLAAYPTYQQYADQMAAFAADHSDIAELIDIGGTVQGVGGGDKRLLFIKLSDNVSVREAEPRVMYTSSMHGDEIAGFPSMLNLIDHFIFSYKDDGLPTDTRTPERIAEHLRIKDLLDNSEVWINPLANPDATYWLDNTNTSVTQSRRENANDVDLNRNYPDNVDGAHPDGEAYQTETLAFMQFADDYHFVLSANLHGGIELVNYPFDNTYATSAYPSEHLPEDSLPYNSGPFYTHPDTNWFEYVSVEYATQAQTNSPNGYMTTDEDSYIYPSPGVTHGAEWYRVYGGRQDYMNFYHQCREITVEISDVKTPPSTNTSNNNEVIDIWNYNKEAYIKYLIQGTYGFRGIVKDASTGDPIDAKISIVGRDDQTTPITNSWVKTETLYKGTELGLGDFYRPIEAGTYDILIEADCYAPVTFSSQSIANYQTIVLDNSPGTDNTILLTPSAASAPSSLTETNITAVTATLNWEDLNVTSYDIQYRVNGTSTWTTTSSVTNSLAISGLTANTTYEYQVRSICGATSSNYSSPSKEFTTLEIPLCTGASISSYPYSEGFENATTFNDNWVQGVNGTNDDIDWTRDLNGTVSSNTGPSSAVQGSYYLYTEASGNGIGYPNKEAIIISPCFNLTGYKNAQFSFNYHWYGNNIDQASLNVEVSSDDGVNFTNVFNRPTGGTSNNSWVSSGVINLSSYNGQTIKLKIIGITGDGQFSDMAIDNITLTAEVDSSLGIQDELLSTFNLYPNPSDIGEIKLTVPNEIQEFNIEISNVLGQKVLFNKTIHQTNKIHTINTTEFKSGIYFVTISTNLGRATKKIIIE